MDGHVLGICLAFKKVERMRVTRLRYMLASSKHLVPRMLVAAYRTVRALSIPAPKIVIVPMLWLFLTLRSIYFACWRIFICEPLLKAYCTRFGRGLKTGVFIHWIQGQGVLSIGDDVVMDGKSSILFAARYAIAPRLSIGDGTFVGHNCTFAIADSVQIGRRCLLSTDVCFRDYDGHPINPADRAAGLHADNDAVIPIQIGDNVWIGMRAIILKGVTIGNNSIVGAGAVVTKDVPANAVVAGNPAKLVKHLDASDSSPVRTAESLRLHTVGQGA